MKITIPEETTMRKASINTPPVATPSTIYSVKSQEMVKRRVPKTAAILIKGNDGEFSYASALKKARESISLKDIGIQNTKIRKAHTGGIIIEIAGKDGGSKADTLAERLGNLLTNATVRRPMKRGDVRITGLDDSATPEELRHVIADRFN